MKPYYKSEHGVLYNADCLELMQTYKKNEFDLIFTDPPYGIKVIKSNKRVGTGDHKAKATKFIVPEFWDREIISSEYFIEMERISENRIIFGGNYFTRFLDPSPCWLIWDKLNTASFADCELIYTSFNTSAKIIKYLWSGFLQGEEINKDKQIGNKKLNEKRVHPTQKPIILLKAILNKFIEKNTCILDPFAGSGSTAIAASQLGLSWVIIEKYEEYCEIAAKRLEETSKQGIIPGFNS